MRIIVRVDTFKLSIKKMGCTIFIGTMVSLLFNASCSETGQRFEQEHLYFEFKPSELTGVYFQNELRPTKEQNIFNYNYFFNGGGVGIADFNNDGWDDIFFTGNHVSSELYLNQGDWKFNNITKQSNVGTDVWVTGVSIVDINSDGWQDIYLSVAGSPDKPARKNLLFINQGLNAEGIPIFLERAEEFGLADEGYTTQTVFFDYDLDGDLDAYVLNHWHDMFNPNYPKEKVLDGSAPSADKLYVNGGNGRFEEVSVKAGILEEGYGLSVGISDFNNDGKPDIYVANDFVYDDFLFVNRVNGTFEDIAQRAFNHTAQFSMGSDIIDINNDSLFDIVTLDMLPKDNYRLKMMSSAMNQERFDIMLGLGYNRQHSRNMIQLNTGESNGFPEFSEVGRMSDFYHTDWSWSVLGADFDHDGNQDLYVTNGIPFDITNKDFIDYRESQIRSVESRDDLLENLRKQMEQLPTVNPSNFLFLGQQGVLFSDKTKSTNIYKKSISNGAAYADLDNDGDLDLIVNNLNSPAFLIENKKETDFGNYLKVRLRGSLLNLDGIGSRVKIITESGHSYFRENYRVRGFQSSQPQYLHFGIGKDTLIKEVQVTWPDGSITKAQNVRTNQQIELKWNEGFEMRPSRSEKKSYFKEVTSDVQISFSHKENSFPDFKSDPLIPWRLSTYGPVLLVGDINNDQLEDIVISGSAGNSGCILTQNESGKFQKSDLPDGGYEDAGMHLFDADGDGDLDLYVASGGVEYVKNTVNYQDRFYSNDGRGNFKRDFEALPSMVNSGSTVLSMDFDNDGDLDLFVGGWSVPGDYPKAERSYLLRNDSSNGTVRFVDISSETLASFGELGIVADAITTDFNNDGWSDLIVLSKWRTIMFFKNNQGTFVLEDQNLADNHNQKYPIDKVKGLWNTIIEFDQGQDGDKDYIIGNYGLNNSFDVSLQHPMGVVAKDFDKNGKIEPIFTTFINDTLVTLMGRDEIASALPAIKKKYRNYTDFAKATFDEIFPETSRKDAIEESANFLSSIILKRQHDGTYGVCDLVQQAQYGPINAILNVDFDMDGLEEILLIGNVIEDHYMYGNQDALGVVLLKNNKGSLEVLRSKDIGVTMRGHGSSVSIINVQGVKTLVILENNGPLRFYQYQMER